MTSRNFLWANFGGSVTNSFTPSPPPQKKSFQAMGALVLMLLMLVAAIDASSCDLCVMDGGLWCFSLTAAPTPGGLLSPSCLNASLAPDPTLWVGCLNASVGCSCSGDAVLGCSSCLDAAPYCVWCGEQSHRGVGICVEGPTMSCGDEFATVLTCPVPGMPTWVTFVISIGSGILLSSVVVLAGFIQERLHQRKYANSREAGSLLEENNTTTDDEQDG